MFSFNKKAFTGATVGEGQTGKRTIVQLFNPVDSIKKYKITSITVCSSYSGAGFIGLDIRDASIPVGIVKSHGRNKVVGGSESEAEVRIGNVIPSEISGDVLYEGWMGKKTFEDKVIPMDPPLILNPGVGVSIIDANDYTWMPVTFEYEEC